MKPLITALTGTMLHYKQRHIGRILLGSRQELHKLEAVQSGVTCVRWRQELMLSALSPLHEADRPVKCNGSNEEMTNMNEDLTEKVTNAGR